jgi:4a-hydroxytetrahydrobiopterin dehydratase
MKTKKYYSSLKREKAIQTIKLFKEEVKKSLEKKSIFNKQLKKLQKSGWKKDGISIVKIFKTKNFPQTMALVSGICGLCQQHDHHPDYLTMKYAEVKVSFSTHSAGELTQKDLDIAKDIEGL